MEGKGFEQDCDNGQDEDAELLALTELLADCADDSLHVKTSQKATSSERKATADVKEIAAYNDFDSSDEVEVTNFMESTYNGYGCAINNKLKQQQLIDKDAKIEKEVNLALNSNRFSGEHDFQKYKNIEITERVDSSSIPKQQQPTVCMDPVFGLRIINPLISSSLLVERMKNRKAVYFSNAVLHIQRADLSQDWVIAGVVINKRPVQITKNNQPYSIWQLSDLKGDIKTLSLFLFRSAHKELWKTEVGMCIAILNPVVFEKRTDSKDIACLSIDTSQKVMVLGKSKDLGTCKARTRNGNVCNATINTSDCSTCVFHMKQEFAKMSRRSELQSASTSRGLQSLRNKILGKSEVFYGGQSFTALPAKKSFKQTKKDADRLQSLSEYAVSPFAKSMNHSSKPKAMLATQVPYEARHGPISKVAANVDISSKQRIKDLERLRILKGDLNSSNVLSCPSDKVEPKLSDTNILQQKPASSILAKLQSRSFSSQLTSNPTLSKFENFSFEINTMYSKAELAKRKAKEVLDKKPIEKQNPNSMRGTQLGKRRAIDILNERFQQENDTKRQKLQESEKNKQDRIQRIMEAASSHADLVKTGEKHLEDVYFDNLSKKEALEEKMLNTHKVPCKAVICSLCKYTAFSAAERCKKERHPIKVVDAVKRFFRCKQCNYRTVTLFKLPKGNCKQCDSSHWERAGMIRERKVCTTNEDLSIRGDEELFMGSISGKKHLNLLVPSE